MKYERNKVSRAKEKAGRRREEREKRAKETKMTKRTEQEEPMRRRKETRAASEESVNFYIISGCIHQTH